MNIGSWLATLSCLGQATQPAAPVQSMTIGGWVFMLASISCVVSLITFCFYRVLRKPAAANHMHAPLEIDTHDLENGG